MRVMFQGTSLRLCVLLAALMALWVSARAADCAADPEVMLREINALRAAPQRCGAHQLPAAPALQWNAALGESSQRYAEELAQRDEISHQGVVHRSLRQRLAAVGYAMSMAGENLSGGAESLDQVLLQWLSSPVHCDSLMSADFADVGLACVQQAGRFGHFWVLHLASPLAAAAQRPGRR